MESAVNEVICKCKHVTMVDIEKALHSHNKFEDVEKDITYHFSGCYKVKIEHEIEYHKNIASKELTRCQIPYFMQDVEVKELQIDSNRYMEYSINAEISMHVRCLRGIV